MMKVFRIVFFLFAIISICVIAVGCTNTYTATWQNDDGSLLQQSTYSKGETPLYDSPAPQKAADAEYIYAFTGWDRESAPIAEDIVYRAIYEKTVRNYTVSWVNDDGTPISAEALPYGTVPQYQGDTPQKAEDAEYRYTFTGWDKEAAPLTQDTTYTAQYSDTKRSYTVTWKDADGTVLSTETLPYGTMPKYESTIATTIDHQTKKTFSGWSPAPSTITENVEYRAQYTSEMVFPAVRITVEGEIDSDYSDCTITTVCDDERYNLKAVAGQIKVRGNGTAQYDKKPYRIKFAKKQTMFGLNDDLRAKSWVLLAEYTDRTMLKNATAFSLARKILGEDGYYVSDCMFVEVYLNDEYNGLYLLAEQQQVNEGRIEVAKSSEKNPTTKTGYLVEMDNYALTEDVYFTLTYSPLRFIGSETTTNRLQTRYTVKSDIYSDEQSDFIRRKLQNTWLVLYDAAYTDRSVNATPYYTVDENGDLVQDPSIGSAQEAAERVIDVRSLVDTWILQEICENIDVGWSSFFISVDCSDEGSSKLIFEAPWDFDWALGQKGYIANGYYSAASNNNAPNIYNPWILVICNQSWFVDSAAKRWQELNADTSIIQDVIEEIDLRYENGKQAFDRNFERWQDIMTYVHPSHTSSEYAAADNQEEAVAWLKTFLQYREVFLNYAFRSVTQE